MKIREFDHTGDDALGILAVDSETFQDMALTPDELLDRAQRPENQIFIAESESGEVVGFISLMEAHTLHGIGLWIDLIAVLPAFQKLGVASLLVEKALDYGREIGVAYSSALVRSNNQASLKTLQKSGYLREKTTFELMIKGLK